MTDCFLPFDLDSAFSASFVLLLATGIHPRLVPDRSHIDTIYQILDSMSMKGNLLASLRRSEIEELRAMLDPGGLGAMNHGFGAPGPVASSVNAGAQDPIDTASLPSLGDPFFDVWNLNNDGVGFSGEQLLTLADELGNEDWGDFQWLDEQG